MNKSPENAYDELVERNKEITSLQQISQLLSWDQEVGLPSNALQQRAQQSASLQKVIHEKKSDPRWNDVFERLDAKNTDWNEREWADIRDSKKNFLKASKVPARLVEETTKLRVEGYSAWKKAREENQFSLFETSFQKLLEKQRETASYIQSEGQTHYDVFLDAYEPNASEEKLVAVFSDLREGIVPIFKEIMEGNHQVDPQVLEGDFSKTDQKRLSTLFATELGYNWDCGRLDDAIHPFCSGCSTDVRMTNRYNPRQIQESLFGVFHETGHALYEQGRSLEMSLHPWGDYCSMGIHESQSRFWENIVGRSFSFWKTYFSWVQAIFPKPFAKMDPATYFKAINYVSPSFIRTESDEVTYNLHVILRFQIERELMNGQLQVKEIPERWNQQFQEDFGLTPSHLKEGCLQDIHWAEGLMGYFPTYSLGNLYASQFTETMEHDLGKLSGWIEERKLNVLLDWLREKIHTRGRIQYAETLCEEITGKKLSSEPFIRYLRNKFLKQIPSL